MPGVVALKLKIMPQGLDVNLKDVSSKCEKLMASLGSKNISIVEEPIAFGLKALVISCAWNEDKSVDEAENGLNLIPGVSSCEVTDYRRAFG